jgi:hypothetical protein
VIKVLADACVRNYKKSLVSLRKESIDLSKCQLQGLLTEEDFYGYLPVLQNLRPLLLLAWVIHNFYTRSFATTENWGFDGAGRTIAANALQLAELSSEIYEQYKQALNFSTLG